MKKKIIATGVISAFLFTALISISAVGLKTTLQEENSYFNPIVTNNGLPDLVIELNKVGYNFALLGYYADFSIKNIGTGDVPGVAYGQFIFNHRYTIFDDNGNEIWTQIMGSRHDGPLKPGQKIETLTLFVGHNLKDINIKGGYTLTIEVDSGDKIEESNEANNIMGPEVFPNAKSLQLNTRGFLQNFILNRLPLLVRFLKL